MKKMKKLLSLATLCIGVSSTSIMINAEDYGGWSESDGYFTNSQVVMSRATPSHKGWSETSTISGTTHKRSCGRTTWDKTRHYTRATIIEQMLFVTIGTPDDTGRVWGTGSTSATTKWVSYKNRESLSARSYYGK